MLLHASRRTHRRGARRLPAAVDELAVAEGTVPRLLRGARAQPAAADLAAAPTEPHPGAGGVGNRRHHLRPVRPRAAGADLPELPGRAPHRRRRPLLPRRNARPDRRRGPPPLAKGDRYSLSTQEGDRYFST